MKALLRLVERSDPNECQRFAQWVNTHYPSRLPLEARTVASPDHFSFWVFAADSGEKGELLGATSFAERTPHLAETMRTVVAPDYRGKGIGSLISQLIESEVRDRGYKKIRTTILIKNLPMIWIKLKQGYLVEGLHPHHELPDLHEYSLGKMLD